MGEKNTGRVFWLTGFSGAGKSTLARLLVKRLKQKQCHVVYIDGDEIRSALAMVDHYSFEERKKLAFIYCRLSKMLANQGLDVVIATISMFHECHKWNREHQPQYYEIYVRVSQEVLMKRNTQKLPLGDMKNRVGIDILPELPVAPDVIIDNNGDRPPEEVEEELYQRLLESCDLNNTKNSEP
jgi:adenylylsulfate kinase